MLTYKNIQDRVLNHLDEAGDTGTTLDIVKDVIQSAHNIRLVSDNWPFMEWPQVETFTAVVDQTRYSLHQEYQRPIYFYNRATKRFMVETPHRGLPDSGKDWNNDSGHPERFFLDSKSPVSTNLSAASAITMVSSSTSDTTPTVIIRGMTATGVTTETLTANGTTPVVGTTTFSVNGILNITKTGTWVGTLTLTDASANTLLTLFPTEVGRKYQEIQLYQKPSSADVIEYKFYRNPSPLSNDNDIPDIPYPFDELLVWDTLLLLEVGYNTESNPMAVELWKENRTRIFEAMQKTYLSGQTLGAEPRYVRDLSDVGSGPFTTSIKLG